MFKESRLYYNLKNAIGKDYFLQRVESKVDVGIPDLFFAGYSSHRPTGWMELKIITLPGRVSTPVRIPFRPGQIGWMHKALKAGVLYLLLVMSDKGYFLFEGDAIKEKYALFDFYDKSMRFTSLNASIIFEDKLMTFQDYLDSLGRTNV